MLKLEKVLDTVHVKKAIVDISALSESDRIKCHSFTPSGNLLFGTAEGHVYITRGAVPPGGPTPPTWGNEPPLFSDPYACEILSQWEAGAVFGIHLTATHLILVFECPDSEGGLVLWLQGSEPKLCAHVELPVRRCVASCLSPDVDRLLVCDEDGRTVVTTTHGTVDDYLEVASEAHTGRVVGIVHVHGVPSHAGVVVASLEEKGKLHVWTAQENVQV